MKVPHRQRLQIWTVPPAQIGGIQTYTRNLQRALRQLPATEFEVIVYQPGRLLSFLAGSAWRTFYARPDLIFVTHLHWAPWAAVLARLFRLKFWVAAHGIEAWTPRSRWHEAALRRADRVLAVSRVTAQRLVRPGGARPERLTVLPNVIDGECFTPGPRPESLLRRYGFDRHDPIIFTLTRLQSTERYKGIDAVLAAVAELSPELPSLRYLLAGSGDDLPRLRREIEARGLGARVVLAGAIPESELVAHFRLADLFVLPSQGEGFGLVYLEALACACPVVAAASGGAPEALAEGAWGRLVPPGDALALVEALRATLREARSEAARCRALTNRAEMLERFGFALLTSRLQQWLEPVDRSRIGCPGTIGGGKNGFSPRERSFHPRPLGSA